MTTNPRAQVLLNLLPPGAVFRHCYSDDSLWRAESRGYINERDPLRAGLYPPNGLYAPWLPPSETECAECSGTGACEDDNDGPQAACWPCGGTGYVHNPGGRTSEHSFTVPAAGLLSNYAANVQDGTALALLLDEVLRLRAQVDALGAALVERGHTDECYSGEITECDCPLRVLGEGGAA